MISVSGRLLLGTAMTTLLATSAQAVEWLTDADANWGDVVNWSSGILPGPLDDVLIDVGGPTVRRILYAEPSGTVRSVTSQEFLDIRGGLTVSGAFSNTATTQISTVSGVLRLNDTSSLADLFIISGGTLAGNGVVTVRGTGRFTAPAVQLGTGTTIYEGPVEAGANAQVKLGEGRRVEFHGGFTTDTITTNINFNGSSAPGGGTVQNAVGSLFLDRTGSGRFFAEFGGPVRFENAGIYRRSIGAGSDARLIQVPLYNAGTVEVERGNLLLDGRVDGASGTTLTGGSWLVRSRSGSDRGEILFTRSTGLDTLVTNAADITLAGPNAAQHFRTGGAPAGGDAGQSIRDTLTTNAAGGVLRVQDGLLSLGTAETFRNDGLIALSNGQFASVSVINTGTVVGHGAFEGGSAIANTGVIRASGGELAVRAVQFSGGTLATEALASMRVSGSLAVDVLEHVGTRIFVGGSGIISVAKDYRNGAFGTGNAFFARANLVMAEVNATSAGQVLSAIGMTGGDTATPVLALGNRRVGDSINVTIANSGSETMLRGAVRDAGAPALSIVGGDSFAIAAGGTAQFAVSTLGTAPGLLSGQSIVVANNFDNVADQTLAITGRIYRLAEVEVVASAVPTVVRVGDSVFGVVTLRNIAAADGFSEGLVVGATGSGDIGVPSPGKFIVLAGTSREVLAAVDTSSAGLKQASMDFAFSSGGARSSWLDPIEIGDTSVAFSLTVNNRAAPVFTRFGSALAFDSALGGHVLDLGRLSEGALFDIGGLGLGNLVFGPSDDLSGFVSLASGGPWAMGGPFDIGLLSAGALPGPFNLSFDPSTRGHYLGELVFAGKGTNLSDPLGEDRFARLFVRAAVADAQGVIPEPQTWAMMIIGFGAVGMAARRRRSAVPNRSALSVG